MNDNPIDDTNDDVRSMLRTRAGDVRPSGSWDDVAGRIDAGRRRARTSTRFLAAAAVVLAVAVPVALSQQGDERGVATDDGGPAVTSPATGAQPLNGPVWPTSSLEELRRLAGEVAEGTRPDLADPRAAAAGFLGDTLGKTKGDYSVGDFARNPDEPSGVVTYTSLAKTKDGRIPPHAAHTRAPWTPPSRGAPFGEVLVAQLEGTALWFVTGASDSRLAVHSAAYDGVHLSGEAVSTVDGTLTVTVHAAGADGSGLLSDESVSVVRGKPIDLTRRVAGKPALVLKLVFSDRAGTTQVSALRLESAAEAPQSPRQRADSTCSGSTVTDGMIENVSDGGAPVELPAEVSARRAKIIELARACDFDGLAALAPPSGFQFSYGADKDPAAYWRRAEADGEPVLRMLALTLHLRPVAVARTATQDVEGNVYGPGGRTYVWPVVAGTTEPAAADWDALLRLYGDDEVAQWKRENNFLGYRVGIDDRGTWQFFVAGD